jgi:hypothetical protein
MRLKENRSSAGNVIVCSPPVLTANVMCVHLPSLPLSKTLKELKTETRKRPQASLKEIYDDVSVRRKSSLGPEFDNETLPAFPEIRTVMRNERAKTLPPLPQSIAEIKEKITPDMMFLSGEQFVSMEDDIMMFASEEMLSLIEGNELCVHLLTSQTNCVFASRTRRSGADKLYMDGTFFVCPGLFDQLYSVHTMVEDAMVCCAYFLLRICMDLSLKKTIFFLSQAG